MRSSGRAALVVLSAVALLLGVVPAARAADVSLDWSSDGGVLRPGSHLAVCPTGAAFEDGQRLVVEVLQGGTRVGGRTIARAAGEWCFGFAPLPLLPRPGRYAFRASSRVPSTGEVLTTPVAIFSARGDDGRIAWLDSGEFQASDAWMGAGVRLSTRSASSRLTRVMIDQAHGQVIDLQRRSGSRWVTVHRVRAPATGAYVRVTLRFPPRPGMSKHRFVSRATAWSPTVVTPSFTVYQSAARTKAAYAAEARDYMSEYCPKTPITLDTPAVRSGGVLGQANASWGYSGGQGFLSTTIELRSGMSPDQLRAVALHECAHVVQYRAAVNGRYGAVEEQARKLWPRVGVEGQADCMSYRITGQSTWFGYVDSCSSAQVRNAETMWRAYGHRYQAAVHRW